MRTKNILCLVCAIGIFLSGCGNIPAVSNASGTSSSAGITSDPVTSQNSSESQISTVYFDSSTLGTKQRMQIYTPAGYEDSEEAYPVLYLINGGGSDDTDWITNGNMQIIMDELILNGEAKPMIVVMPDGGMNAVSEETNDAQSSTKQGDGQAVDSNLNANGQNGGNNGMNEDVAQEVDPVIAQAANDKRNQFVLELTSDIIPYVTMNYRTIDAPESRAVAGFSYGGGEALWAGMTYPDEFAWIGVFSMGIQGGSNANAQPIQGSGSSLTPEEFVVANKDFFADANTTNDKLKLFWIGVGKDDEVISNGAQQLSDTLEQYGIKHEYYESDGGHEMSNGQNYLHIFASKLFAE